MKTLIDGNTPIRYKEGKEWYDKEGTNNPFAKFIYKKYKSSLLSLVPNDKIDDVLEIGCGRGNILNYLDSKLKCNLSGVDIDEGIIRVATELYPNIVFNKGDGRNVPYKDDSFDLVLVLEVLEHVNEINNIIQ